MILRLLSQPKKDNVIKKDNNNNIDNTKNITNVNIEQKNATFEIDNDTLLMLLGL